MVPTTPLETKRKLHMRPAVYAIRICLDDCKTASLGMAVGHGLVPKWDRTWQNGKIHMAHSVIPLCINPNLNKTYMDHGVLTRNINDVAFCLRGSVAQMRNGLRESPTMAYRT